MRVGMWGDPDPAAPTLSGAAVRALVLPQLFVALPDGTWRESLVRPGSVRESADKRSATFLLATGAKWSDDTPIAAADLRRTADARYVAGVDDPGPDGRITVRFTQPLPNWRRLWSFTDSIAAPAPNVWGGPFLVRAMTPGLETVLVRNDKWAGPSGPPPLDEIRLTLVPDPTTARQLLEAEKLDVLMPPAAPVRGDQLRAIEGVSVRTANRSGWWVGVRFNPGQVDLARRKAVAATFDRDRFAAALLGTEAFLMNGFLGPEDATWASIDVGDASALKGRPPIQLTVTEEEPMSGLLAKAAQKRARAAGSTYDVRAAEAERTEVWVATGDYEAAVVMAADPPGHCWTCRWGTDPLATAADSGDGAAATALEARLRDEMLVLPLWRPVALVAWRAGVVDGLRANGYALSAAWNAWEWHRPEK